MIKWKICNYHIPKCNDKKQMILLVLNGRLKMQNRTLMKLRKLQN